MTSAGETKARGVADDDRFIAFLRFLVISFIADIAVPVLFERAAIFERETSKVLTRFKVITRMNEKSAEATSSSTSVNPSSFSLPSLDRTARNDLIRFTVEMAL